MSRFALLRQLKNQASFSRARVGDVVSVMDTARMRILLSATLFVLGAFYLWLVNTTAAAGFAASDLEQRMSMLEDKYQKYQLQQTELQSLQHIEAMSEEMQLLASTDVTYATGDPAVALMGERP